MSTPSPLQISESERSFFGRDSTAHHVGLAVQSIHAVSPASETTVDETQRVRMAFIDVHGTRIELLEPYGGNSPIARSLEAGVKLLHLCFEVPALEQALEECRYHGFHRISQPTPAPVFDGRRTVWVFSRQFGLFELVERQRHF